MDVFRSRPAGLGRRIGATLLVTGAAIAVVVLAAGCEDTNRENIDKWMRTAKGPGKLKGAVTDRGLAVELRAYAARNLIRIDQTEWLLEALGKLEAGDRQAVIGELAPKLWDDARIEGKMAVPSAPQVSAKDALFDVRGLADADNRTAIDKYLVEWLAGGYYTGRARTGRHLGAQIVRTIGPPAAPRLIERARSVLAEPPDAKGGRVKIEEPLLLALAATGSPDAIEMVLEISSIDRNDPQLPQRAFDALHVAYVSAKTFEAVPGEALAPHVDKLLGIAKDEDQPGEIVNDSIDLIGAIGPPGCIPPLVELVTYPHSNPLYRWVATNAALRCGKAAALIAVTDALPRTGEYARTELEGAIWAPAVKLADPAVVAEQARAMLSSKSWVTRAVGVELLGALAHKPTAAKDAERVRALARDKTVLRGWWGDQSDVPKRDRKRTPRLGQRASEVADALLRLSQG